VKALTVRQPWAALIAAGLKVEEYRGWAPAHRGPLAIHAARALPSWADLAEVRRWLGQEAEAVSDFEVFAWACDQPRGVVVAVAELVAVEQLPAGHPGRRWGGFAWRLASAEPLPRPVRAVGQRGLWDWPADLGSIVQIA
jgi:hypothetical protein